MIYNLPRYFTPIPKAFFVTTKSGQLEESAITKEDIQLFKKIALSNMGDNINMLNKLVYLRRLLEVEGNKNLAWNIISSLFHKRDKPTKKKYDTINNKSTEECLSQKEIEKGESEIKEYLPEFDYNEISGLRIEAQQKLNEFQPLNIGQASRISGVTPADISVLLVYLEQLKYSNPDLFFKLNPDEQKEKQE